MYKVYKNVEMTKEGYLFGIENKEASEKCAPGQYFELKLSGDDHRVPTILTDILSERGIIKVVFRPINDTTRAMARLCRRSIRTIWEKMSLPGKRYGGKKSSGSCRRFGRSSGVYAYT